MQPRSSLIGRRAKPGSARRSPRLAESHLRQSPFRVPAGVQRVTVTFAYTGKDQHTALDLGLLDPVELRCWSGGNKSILTVGVSDATPSCLPGLIPSGEWNVLIGVPNIRAGSRLALYRRGLLHAHRPGFRRAARPAARRFAADLAGIAATSTCTPPTATGNVPARPARWFPVRSTSPSTPRRAEDSTSSPSPTTTQPRSTTPCANCSLTSTSCC